MLLYVVIKVDDLCPLVDNGDDGRAESEPQIDSHISIELLIDITIRHINL